MRGEHAGLAFEAKHRAIDVRLARKHADVIRQIAGGEIIGAVHDQVVISDDLLRVGAGEAAFVQLEFDLRIDIQEPVAGRCQFAAADVLCSVKNLPLQVAKIDTVEIDDAERSNAGCCQIKRSWGAEAASANAQNARCLESLLTVRSHFGHDEMPRVALQFCRTQLAAAGALRIDDAFLHVATYCSTKYWNCGRDPRSRQLWAQHSAGPASPMRPTTFGIV